DCLVRATEFDYSEGWLASFITGVTQSGYARQADGRYLKASLPRLDFDYSAVQVDETVREIDASSIENLPRGVDGGQYRWVDLDSEGLAGVLTEETHSWYYKRNLGGGVFASLSEIAFKPSIAALAGGRQHFLDLAGDGRLDLSNTTVRCRGFRRAPRRAAGPASPLSGRRPTSRPVIPICASSMSPATAFPTSSSPRIRFSPGMNPGPRRVSPRRNGCPRVGTRNKVRPRSSPIPMKRSSSPTCPAMGSRTSCASAMGRYAIGPIWATAVSAPR